MPLVKARRLILQPLAFAACLVLAGVAQAQSLQELYDAARGYDATYLASKASADAAAARAAQAEALVKPSLGLSSSLTQARTDPPGAGTALNARTLTAGLPCCSLGDTRERGSDGGAGRERSEDDDSYRVAVEARVDRRGPGAAGVPGGAGGMDRRRGVDGRRGVRRRAERPSGLREVLAESAEIAASVCRGGDTCAISSRMTTR